jgi:predicted phosphate transport protein (TIGR00153 family)
VQDSLADQAEEIAVLLSFKPLEPLTELQSGLEDLYKKSLDTFWLAKKIIEEIDELLESSFGGIEAEKVKNMVEQTAYLEHETKKKQRALMKKLLSQNHTFSPSSFHLWARIIEEVGSIAELSEKLANRIRMVLELK